MSQGAALIDAIKTGDEVTARSILRDHPECGTERLPSGETAIMTALYRGQRDLAAAIAAKSGDVDIFAAAALGLGDPLQRALGAGHVNDVAYDGWTPLHLAAFFGQLEAAKRLVEAGASLDAISQNSTRNTPLHAAVAGRHADVALLLIDRGASVSLEDHGRHTPLHIAAENNLADVVRALLNRGADPLAVDAEDLTPLARAAAKNHNDIIDLLNERT
ncbi:MAG TPA: ankyrin repeat domain-containing protein [Vicinamibacterales bacterium]|jgi:ankyrin repeat protein|nr:ankyrin repeat domain-containing protein [Vicinamibacterales bacterium]